MVRTPPPPLPRLPLPPRPDRPVRRETRERGQSLSDGVLVERTAGSGTEEGVSPDALHAALRLARNPALAVKFRKRPLPAGIPRLIRGGAKKRRIRARQVHCRITRVQWQAGDAEEALAIAQGKMEPARVIAAEEIDVAGIRKKMKLSQGKFAERFRLSAATVRDWEQKRRNPDRIALNLLRVIEEFPDVVARALARDVEAKTIRHSPERRVMKRASRP